MMVRKRKTGIDVVGDVSWGTHFCQFYQQKEDLIDILVVYFKAGLENNELCLWVTSEPLGVEAAKAALEKAVSNLDDYFSKGQIEILDASHGYTKSGKFEADEVLRSWVEKEKQALERGFEGLRLAGNTSWLGEENWKDFADYEAAVGGVVSKHKMIALCSYPLDRCGAIDVIDVVGNHQFSLIRRGNDWQAIGSSEHYRTYEALQVAEQNFRNSLDNSPLGTRIVTAAGELLYANQAILDIYGYSSIEELRAVPIKQRYTPASYAEHVQRVEKRKQGKPVPASYEINIVRQDGEIHHLAVSRREVAWNGEIQFQALYQDITERKQAEEALTESERKYRSLFDEMFNGFAYCKIIVDENNKPVDFVYLEINDAFEKLTGLRREDVIGRRVTEAIPGTRESHPELFSIYGKVALTGEPTKFDIYFKPLEIWLTISVYSPQRDYFVAVFDDITERKQAEESLQAAEQNFRNSLDNSPMGIRIGLTEGGILYGNKALLDIYGYSSIDELKTVPAKQRYTPKSYAEHMQRRERRKQGKPVAANYEVGIIRKDGQVRHIVIFHQEVIWSGQARIQSIFQDITERKQAEEALRESEEFSASLLNNSPNPVVVINPDTSLRYINPALEKLTGFTAAEVVGRKAPYPWWPAEIVGEISIGLKESMRRGVVRGERYFQKKSGELFWVEITAMPVKKDGELNYHLSTWVEVTERKQAEEALRAAEQNFRSSLDNSPIGIRIGTIEGEFLYANQAYLDIAGYSSIEEFMAVPAKKLFTPESYTGYRERTKRRQSGKPVPSSHEISIVRKDGEIRQLAVSHTEVIWDGSPQFQTLIQNITERKRMEKEKLELEQKAYAASHMASIGEMAAGIAHEINNPLTGVIGFSQLLMKKDMPEDIMRDASIINESAQRVASIVSRMLLFARQRKPERKYIDINEVIKNTFELLAYELEANNIKVITQLSPDLPWTMADASQLQQAFLNIILNAGAEMKGISGKGKLMIKTELINAAIHISFVDNGGGIAVENLDRIFNPFFTTKDVGEGTGLGLSVSHGIIVEHNGRLYVKNNLDKGATFTVELPILLEDEQPEMPGPAVDKTEKVNSARILVVDDEFVVRQLLSDELTGEGHIVETASDASEALSMIKKKRYSLILLDIKLPGMDGIELYDRIKQIARSLIKRVIFVTGDVMGADTKVFLAKTKTPYITKPFDIEDLKKKIDAILT
ncbi:PAS domain S-box protein [Chloroflexota bacterium]